SLAEGVGLNLAVLLFLDLVDEKGHMIPAGTLLGRISSAVDVITGGNSAVLASGIVALFLLKNALVIFYSVLSARIRFALTHELRGRIFARYLSTPFLDWGRLSHGTLVNVMQGETWWVSEIYRSIGRMLVNA